MHKDRRLGRERDFLVQLEDDKPALEKQYLRASNSGHWLNTIPNRLNGNQLSAEKFRDLLRLQENLKPLVMPSTCNSCGASMTVDHALWCNTGGLVHIRHDDVGGEFEWLSTSTTTTNPSTNNPPAQQPTSPQQTWTSGVVMVGSTAYGAEAAAPSLMFASLIPPASCRSYWNTDPLVVLQRQEKEKNDKYRDACLECCMGVSPLVYSVGGIPGRDDRGAEKQLARLLSHKWKRPYSQMVHYVCVQMRVAAVRANTKPRLHPPHSAVY
ncbi:hypothetical protein ACHAXR_002932 [Thalassiosira sp. AJA248-18]